MNKRYIFWITFVAINGGLLFGLNMAGIAGAVDPLKEYFKLNDLSLGMAVSSLIIGCLLGAALTGTLSDKYGRKGLMIITALIFIISALGSSLTTSFGVFILSRILGGIAVGASSVLGPTYISEIAPAERRGALVSFNQMAIVTGILVAYLFDYAVIDLENNWRYMLAVPIFFGLLDLILLNLKFPESPRWLLKVGRDNEAFEIFEKIGGKQFAENEVTSISNMVKGNSTNKRVKISEIFIGKYKYILILGTLLAAFQQITGINAIVSYAPTIFKQTGIGSDKALIQSILVGIVNFLFTIIAIKLVDKKGRKVLLLWGAGGMTISLLYLTLSFAFNAASGIGVLISILVYIAFFAASLSPVMWVVTSELYPNAYRGVAMSFSTGVSWACTLLVVQFFPWLINNLGGMISFGIFAGLSLLAFIFIKYYIPETKGKSLEQIEKEIGLEKLKINE